MHLRLCLCDFSLLYVKVVIHGSLKFSHHYQIVMLVNPKPFLALCLAFCDLLLSEACIAFQILYFIQQGGGSLF